MLPSFLLALREGLEAALIIGIVLGVLKKVRKPQFSKSVWGGAGIAALLSLIVALILNAITRIPTRVMINKTFFISFSFE